MKYLLLVCMVNPPDPPLETAQEIADWDRPSDESDDIEQWFRYIEERGARLSGSEVSRPANAATVRVRDGDVLVTDGPYAETNEWMAGYDVIDCADMETAIDIASKHPVAQFGMIEVRPFVPGTGRKRG